MPTPRIAAAAVLIGLCSASASAQIADDSETIRALVACREITDSGAKLACFERETDALVAALENRRVVVMESATARSVDRESFGLSLDSLPGVGGLFRRDGAGDEAGSASPVERVEEDGSVTVFDGSGRLDEMRGLPVEQVTQNRVGQMTVYLGDGQIWRQTDTERVPPVSERRLDGLTAEIQRGAFSSYFMTLSHSNRRFRVERIDQ